MYASMVCMGTELLCSCVAVQYNPEVFNWNNAPIHLSYICYYVHSAHQILKHGENFFEFAVDIVRLQEHYSFQATFFRYYDLLH